MSCLGCQYIPCQCNYQLPPARVKEYVPPKSDGRTWVKVVRSTRGGRGGKSSMHGLVGYVLGGLVPKFKSVKTVAVRFPGQKFPNDFRNISIKDLQVQEGVPWKYQ